MHIPVMLREIIRVLNIKKNGIYIDATFGGGGHTKAILNKLNNEGKLIIFDRDIDSCNIARSLNDHRLIIIHQNFSNIYKIIRSLNLINKIDGILVDLGPSSIQIDNPIRGFSFKKEGPLDMRMDIRNTLSAKNWLKKTNLNKISDVLFKYGDEKKSRYIAQSIKDYLKKKPINTTLELANIIKKNTFNKNKHPATRSFLAIRMFINDEINEINKLLYSCNSILNFNGILVIISFNSIERKTIFHFYHSKQNIYAKKKLLFKFNLLPTKQEISNNPRSRSSMLTVMKIQ